jgi:probable F420-dependent oxidoreductase
MRIGLHALGIGAGAQRAVIDAVVTTAEHHGFSTLWAGEHVVMVDSSSSRYPYTADGRIAVPAAADWLDPLICLSFAAAATSTIRIATGVLLLPEHNPVVAKKAATLDVLSGGRFVLGVGVGWSSEEFAALGIPFARRAARTKEYVAAMRTLWHNDVASFGGDFVRFDAIRVNPKPLDGKAIPLSSVETVTQRCGEWPVGVTAGTGSTSMAPARPPSASATCGHAATTPGATLPTCMWPLRCETQTPPTSRNSPKPASTSWSSSRNRRAVRRRQPRG